MSLFSDSFHKMVACMKEMLRNKIVEHTFSFEIYVQVYFYLKKRKLGGMINRNTIKQMVTHTKSNSSFFNNK